MQPLGGSVYYVGGCVRDRLLGRESKDLDIEVHGVTPQQLEAVLDQMGGRRTVGASFGVYGLAGCGLDIAMPRREPVRKVEHFDTTQAKLCMLFTLGRPMHLNSWPLSGWRWPSTAAV